MKLLLLFVTSITLLNFCPNLVASTACPTATLVKSKGDLVTAKFECKLEDAVICIARVGTLDEPEYYSVFYPSMYKDSLGTQTIFIEAFADIPGYKFSIEDKKVIVIGKRKQEKITSTKDSIESIELLLDKRNRRIKFYGERMEISRHKKPKKFSKARKKVIIQAKKVFSIDEPNINCSANYKI